MLRLARLLRRHRPHQPPVLAGIHGQTLRERTSRQCRTGPHDHGDNLRLRSSGTTVNLPRRRASGSRGQLACKSLTSIHAPARKGTPVGASRRVAWIRRRHWFWSVPTPAGSRTPAGSSTHEKDFDRGEDRSWATLPGPLAGSFRLHLDTDLSRLSTGIEIAG